MSPKTSFPFALFFWVCITTITAFLITPVRAQTVTTENNCLNCHENLYFLHDTGNWFCLRESPMQCVDCHGGDPQALTQERAHLNRAVHPIINEDISKCQLCHPAECYERVELFDQKVGLSQILVAAPYAPPYSTGDTEVASSTGPQPGRGILLTFWEIVPIVLVTGLALTIYFVARRQHYRKDDRR